jgi:hypothetical protein
MRGGGDGVHGRGLRRGQGDRGWGRGMGTRKRRDTFGGRGHIFGKTFSEISESGPGLLGRKRIKEEAGIYRGGQVEVIRT